MDVERYLQALPWSDQATDDEKTLVDGNIRSFFAEMQRATTPLFEAAVAIEQQIDEQSPTDGLADHPDDHQIAVTLTLAEVRALTRAINQTGWADVSNSPPQEVRSEESK